MNRLQLTKEHSTSSPQKNYRKYEPITVNDITFSLKTKEIKKIYSLFAFPEGRHWVEFGIRNSEFGIGLTWEVCRFLNAECRVRDVLRSKTRLLDEVQLLNAE